VNHSLEELYIDDNGVTATGFQMLKVGLTRNTTLKFLSFPTMDLGEIMSVLKDKQQQTHFSHLMNDIQTRVFKNNSNKELEGTPSARKGFSQYKSTTNLNKTQVADAAPTSNPSGPGVTITVAPPAKKQPPIPPPKSQHRLKPDGIDTQHASALFGQLNQFISEASKELTSDEMQQLQTSLMVRKVETKPSESNAPKTEVKRTSNQ
jgi:hypothetical protein